MTLSRSNPRAKSRWAALAIAVVALILLVSGITLAANPSSQSLFELDGDALNDTTLAGDDWSNIWSTCPSGSGSTVAANFVECSFVGESAESLANDTTYFTTGGSKDVNDVSQWKYNGNSVPDKNQITNAYAAQYVKDGRQFIYFGADRFSNDGDSSLGFWFFKGGVALSNGSFVGTHQNGDLFIVSDFSNGGSVGTVVAYQWMNGALQPLSGGTGGDCTTAPATANICGRVNGGDATAPWSYTPKANVGSPGTFPHNTFFEGGIDLTAFSGGQQTCFSTFLAETRSSTSTTAQLKDFALGGFDTCDARISISPSGVNAVGGTHTFTVKVERSFGGAFQGVSGLNPVVTLTQAGGATVSGKVDNCATSGTNASGECTVSFTSNAAGTVTGSATAQVPFPGGSPETVTTNGQNGSSGTVTKRFVDAAISIAASATNEVSNQHVFTITVTPLAAGTTVSTPTITTSLTPTPVAPQTSSTTCGAPSLQMNGTYTCTLTVNSPTATSFTANASATITFTGTGTPASANVTRDTDANSPAPSGPGGSGPATKTFVDASIAIAANDTNGIGESHTFTITVKKDEGLGGGLVAVSGVNPTVSLTGSGGASAVIATNTCTSGTNASGQCSITFTSNTAGQIVGNASITLTVGGQTLTRDTNASTPAPSGPSGSGSATKTFVAGTLVWLKVDQNDDLLGGATFRVCQTHTLDSSTNPDSMVEIVDENDDPDPICRTVDDEDGFTGTSPDADAADGKFKLVGLILGRYTIEETVAPPGYKKDTSIETVDLTLANPDNSVLDDPATTDVDESHPDGIPTFVNEKLFRLIVLTCNESTGELVVSSVTLTGQTPATKDTIADVPTGINLPAGVTEQMLCDLGGASFGGLEDGTYGPSVVIPKP